MKKVRIVLNRKGFLTPTQVNMENLSYGFNTDGSDYN
jgi:hypothetical protein